MTVLERFGAARVKRSVLPRAALAAWALRARAGAARVVALRRLGVPVSVELFVAFDDPYGAVALPGLLEIARHHPLAVTVRPVLRHGLEGDPDLEARRAHAVVDADRLLRRTGARLHRRAPVEPVAVRFLAAWVEAARARGRATEFAAAAFSSLWVTGSGPVTPEAFEALYVEIVGEAPPRALGSHDRRLEANARRLRAKGHWETPAARLAGQWFFAHERLEQIAALAARLAG